jgi:hypothetical protein
MGTVDEVGKILNINKNEFGIQIKANTFIIWKHVVKLEI